MYPMKWRRTTQVYPGTGNNGKKLEKKLKGRVMGRKKIFETLLY
jgi:hypothetical protein